MISQTLKMLKILKIQCFICQTYHKHTCHFKNVEEHKKLVERLSNLEGGVLLSGDGKSDSPGHSAKYGAFTVIEQTTNKVLDILDCSIKLSIKKPLAFLLKISAHLYNDDLNCSGSVQVQSCIKQFLV